LKRFDNYQRKIRKFIKYDEYLNLSNITKNNLNETIQYKICSMLIHKGTSIDSGHYYSFVRASNNDWYIFNDHSVKKVERHFVLEQKPYLLFYEKLIEKPKKGYKSNDIEYSIDQMKNNKEDIIEINNYGILSDKSIKNSFDNEPLDDKTLNNCNYNNSFYNKKNDKEYKNEFSNYCLRNKPQNI